MASTQELSDEEEAARYDPGKFDRPSVTVDVVMFTIVEKSLRVLLIRRGEWPFRHQLALPGGFVRMDETLEQAAARKLGEETGVEGVTVKQLHAFSSIDRDPRTRVITVAYYALIESSKVTGARMDYIESVDWFELDAISDLAFDHEEILTAALAQMREDCWHQPVAFQLLPKKFTLTDLQETYEIVLGSELDKRNFRKKIQGRGLVEALGEKRRGSHRPAELYRHVSPSRTD